AGAAGNQTVLDDRILDLGTRDDGVDLTIKQRHDLLWRLRWRDKHLPGVAVEARHAGFGNRRDIRFAYETLRGTDGESAQLTLLHKTSRGRNIAKHHLDDTAERVGHHRNDAAIRNLRHSHVGHVLKHFHEDGNVCAARR